MYVVKFVNRIKNSLAFRSTILYRKILNVSPIPILPPKPDLSVVFLTLCGAYHLRLLCYNLYSLYLSWPKLPCLRLISDGTVSLNEMAIALKWWPGKKDFLNWEDIVAYYCDKGQIDLVNFAERSVVGKKLACLLHAGELVPTLWCDADILWFRMLPDLKELLVRPPCVLKVSEDCEMSYDHNLLNSTLNYLKGLPFINTGLVFLYGDLLKQCELSALFKFAAKSSNHFTEQTILAHAAYSLGAEFWPMSDVWCSVQDMFSLFPTYVGQSYAARHYIATVRHLFWRDALALRLGVRPKYSKLEK